MSERAMTCTRQGPVTRAAFKGGVLRRFRGDRRGVSAVEFALVAPVMIGLYFGVVEVSDGVSASRKVSLAAATVANLSAQVSTISSSDMSNKRHTLFAFILPFMEQSTVYNGMNFHFGANYSVNVTAQETKIAGYVCPSDLPSTGPINPPGGPQISIGVNQGSYSGVAGRTELYRYRQPAGINDNNCNHLEGEGAFVVSWNYKIAGIIDGTSNTLFVGETSRFVGQPSSWQFPWNYGEWFGLVGGTGGGSAAQGIAYTAARPNAKLVDADVSAIIDPDPFTWYQKAAAQAYGSFGFRSLHPGGVNFVMGDGSVKFIKQTINLPTYWALGTRAGGEVISADSY